MRGSTTFVRKLIAYKWQHPEDDILTGLIQAEDEGERLNEDELISMTFLLIVAGYETTVHLINNSVVTLLEHPDQLHRLRRQPVHIETAIEEVLRYSEARFKGQNLLCDVGCDDTRRNDSKGSDGRATPRRGQPRSGGV